MTTLAQARSYLARHPVEAMSDALGLAVISALVLAGFMLPGVF